jgi:hypothetical protein
MQSITKFLPECRHELCQAVAASLSRRFEASSILTASSQKSYDLVPSSVNGL